MILLRSDFIWLLKQNTLHNGAILTYTDSSVCHTKAEVTMDDGVGDLLSTDGP